MFGSRWGTRGMYKVIIERDEETGYFYVSESDILGLNACAPTLDAVVAICEDVIPELIEANHKPSVIARAFSFAQPKARVDINYSHDLALAV